MRTVYVFEILSICVAIELALPVTENYAMNIMRLNFHFSFVFLDVGMSYGMVDGILQTENCKKIFYLSYNALYTWMHFSLWSTMLKFMAYDFVSSLVIISSMCHLSFWYRSFINNAFIQPESVMMWWQRVEKYRKTNFQTNYGYEMWGANKWATRSDI